MTRDERLADVEVSAPRRRWLTVLMWVLAGVLAVASGVGAVRLVWFSSVLAVGDVQVSGMTSVTAESVRMAADLRSGTPLMRVDLDGVRERVLADRRIAWASVTRVWPQTIAIVVRERTPAAVAATSAGWTTVDSSGVGFIDAAVRPPGLVEVDLNGAAAASAIAVASQLPEAVAALVDHVSAASPDDVVLHLNLRPGQAVPAIVRWGSPERTEDKAVVLLALLRQPALVYNVSAPDHPALSGGPG